MTNYWNTNRGMYADAFRILNESESLNEDKMVKFGGEMFPKFGWCVILMGGAASGKGTAFNAKVAIEGDYYNPDNLKEIERMWKIKNTVHGEEPTNRAYEDDFDTPSVKNAEGKEISRTMKNRAFVSELHGAFDDLSKSWKKSIINKGADETINRDRLPNMIFDITAKKLSSVKEIVDVVKPHGYKVAIVWMLTTRELAIANNEHRPRSVDKPILIDAHLGVIKTAEEIFSSNYIQNIDEFWIIDTATTVNPKLHADKYHDLQNVYSIPTNPEGLSKFENIVERIAYNKEMFTREQELLDN